MPMGLLRRGHRVALMLAALAGTGSALGRLPDAIAGQETPRGVTADLFDAALRDTLDTPPPSGLMSRAPIRPGPAVLLVGACGLLFVLARRRWWLMGRGAGGGKRPFSAPVAATSTPELPSTRRGSLKPRHSPRRTKTPVESQSHVIDFLRRRREAQERSESADRERRIPSGGDDASSEPDRPRIDVSVPGYRGEGNHE